MAHHHHHHYGKDFGEANKEYFSSHIAEFDKPQNIRMAKCVVKAMRKQYPFDETSTVVMDFACGVGLISREVAPYAKTVVGVDITQALVDNYNQRVADQGIAPDEMRAVCTELKGIEGELEGLKFDVIVCSASYHHFESIEDITKVLVYFLKPGGALLVIDIQDPSETSPAGSSSTSQSQTLNGIDHVVPQKFHHIVPHTHGFKSDRIRKVFEGAGLTNFTFNKALEVKQALSNFSSHEAGNKSGGFREITFFIAKGEKPSN